MKRKFHLKQEFQQIKRKAKYIGFTPTNEYREISLQEGLKQIQLGNANKLFSDGLKTDEYIYFDQNKDLRSNYI